MKRLFLIFTLLFFAVAIFIATYYAKDAYKMLPINTTLNETPESLSDEWFEYDAPTSDFKVSLPLLPQTATQNLTDPKTDETKHYEMYVAQTDGGTIYMVTLITLSKNPDNDSKSLILNDMMNDMLKTNPENKLKTSSTSQYLGMNSLDFTIENEHTLIEAKEFIRDKTIYLLTVISKKENGGKTHFKYFIDSFKLDPKKEGK